MRKFAALLIGALFISPISVARDYSSYVNPFVGTDGHGHTFPAATLPFGMIQAGPDTRLNGWDGCSGYHYSDSVILGFTHTHLSGTGCLDYGDVLLMPTIDDNVASRFSHASEKAAPGYYEVTLTDRNINVRIAAGRRMAMHEYSYPEDAARRVWLDLNHRDRLMGSFIEKAGDNAVRGWRQSRSWARSQDVYFYAEFSEPFAGVQFRDSSSLMLDFAAGKKALKVRIAISSVSCENARENLRAENNEKDWNLDDLRLKAAKAWNNWLSRIDVKGTDEQCRTFYTALYHCAIHPSLYSDANGEYRGMDRRIHKAEGYDRYTVFSVWDVFRAEFPLLNLIGRDYVPHFLESMLSIYREGGSLPKWELAGNETNTMIGFNAVSILADAFVKGTLPAGRLEEFYEAAKATADYPDESLRLFSENGFDPAGDDDQSVSKTLEYAYDYWCMATMAKALGREDDYCNYIRLSQYWKNVYDPESAFMRPREQGRWAPDFNPSNVTSHFTEANSWQYSFFVPQDISGHITIMGGPDVYRAKLDSLFSADHSGIEGQLVDVTGLVGQYAHGNEPSHHVAYLYDFAGQPWKTQMLTRRICNEFYSSLPDGLCGNEDCGQMSAWYVLSTLGMYSVTPGTDIMALSSPIFRKALINTGISRFTVRADSPEKTYIASAKFNGKAYDKAALSFRDILKGGRLEFTMSDELSSFGIVPSMVTSVEPEYVYYAVFEKDFGKETDDGHMLTMKVTNITPFQEKYNAGGPDGLVDGKRGRANWRAGGWQGYCGCRMDIIVDLLGERTIDAVSAGFLQDMNNYIWMPSLMEVFVSADGEHFIKIGERRSDVPIDLEKILIQDWKVEFEPVTATHVRIVAHQFGTIPSWHRGYGADPFIFVDEVSVNRNEN